MSESPSTLGAKKENEQQWVDTMFLVGNKMYEMTVNEKYYKDKEEKCRQELKDLLKKAEKINARALYLNEQNKEETTDGQASNETAGSPGVPDSSGQSGAV